MLKKNLSFAIELLFAASCVVSAAGCSVSSDDDDSSKASAQSLCNEMADVQCDRTYDCYSSADIVAAGLPSTVTACKSRLRSDLGCDAADPKDLCTGNKTFQSTTAQSCIRQYKTASCNQIQSATQMKDFAPACDEVCAIE